MTASIRILHVDDEPDFADMAATFLERENDRFTVETALSASEGLDRLADDTFDCVVSDYKMAGQNGIEFLETVREDYPTLPFLLVTAKGSEEVASEAISSGVTDYLQKESGTDQYARWANRIENLVEGHRSQQALTERRRRLETLIDNLPGVVYRCRNEPGWPMEFFKGECENLLGYPPSALENHDVSFGTDIIHPEDRESVWETVQEALDAGSTFEITYRIITKADTTKWVWERGRAIDSSDDEGEILEGFITDITDHKQREERLAGLNDVLVEYLEADSKQRLCNITADATRERLKLPVTLIALFDDETGSLRPMARTPAAQEHMDEERLLQQGGVAWEVFASDDPTVVAVSEQDAVDESLSTSHLVGYPLGKHGVLVTAVSTSDDGVEAEAEFVQTVSNTLRDAFDRIEREELLREREELLEEQNEWLDRLNRINDVIRRIDQVLVGAATRKEIERAVCEELADDGPYQFAWIGTHDPVTDRVEPRERAGDDQGYLDGVSVTLDTDATDQDPTARAVQTREPQVIENLLTDPPFEPWREAALERGYRSCIALPLSYRDQLYGILTVYADQLEIFDELERNVLGELADTIAYAVNSVERKRALLSDEVVELTFTVEPTEIPLLEDIGQTPGSEFELESIVPTDGGTYRMFFTHDIPSCEEESGVVDQSPGIRDHTVIANREGNTLSECIVTEESIIGWLLDHGAIPRSLSTGEHGGHLTIQLSKDADVRNFVDRLKTRYSGMELVARHEHERTSQTRQEFQAELEERLTPRQQEILRTAYSSGYFNTPRERDGQEIASSIGISQPTFSDHLRSGLRKLCGMLYEDEPRHLDNEPERRS